eukprot:929595-Amorphochlora_amoeboformis.AAC.1
MSIVGSILILSAVGLVSCYKVITSRRKTMEQATSESDITPIMSEISEIKVRTRRVEERGLERREGRVQRQRE